MKILLKFIKPYTKYFVIGPVFKLTEAVLELLVPTIMAKYLIDKGVGSGDVSYIVKVGVLMLALAIVGMLCALVCQYSASVASQGTGTALRNSIFKHIGTLSFRELDKFGTGSLLNRITSDVNTIQQAVAMTIRIAIRAPFVCFGSVVMALVLNWKLGLYILATIPVLALVIFLIMRRTIPLYKDVQGKLDDISTHTLENLAGVKVVRAFARQRQEKKQFDTSVDAYTTRATFVGKIAAVLNPTTVCIMNLLIVIILYAGGKSVQVGEFSQGEIVAFTTYITYMLTALFALADYILLFTRAVAGTNRIKDLLETQSSVQDGKGAAPNLSGTALEFKDVSFSYNQGGETALSNINFALEQGESLGVIGGIGSGKSTLANLVCRFYDCDSGQVSLFGSNITDYKLSAVRELVSVARQKAELFSGTVYSNISACNPSASESDILRAADISQCTEFLSTKPEGINTPVEAHGANLSGGQRQRVALAGALVRKTPVLILDDSSSALDYATDLKLRRAIRENDSTKNLIIVSQRVSTIADCDKILVLDDGEQVGFGTHDQLLSQCDVYRSIYHSQTKGGEC